MSVRQVMEYMDELVKNGQLPGQDQQKEEKPDDQVPKEECKEEAVKKKRFLSKIFKQKEAVEKPEIKVMIKIPDQTITLSQEDFVKFSKLILETDLKINKAEIVKTKGDDKHGDN